MEVSPEWGATLRKARDILDAQPAPMTMTWVGVPGYGVVDLTKELPDDPAVRHFVGALYRSVRGNT